ncbi:MAG: tetratricopeptide repeat protein [Pseudomonadota bacterium]
MKVRISAAALAASMFLAGGASAQVFVIGTGLGAECFNKTQTAYSSFNDAEQTCSRALREEAMTAKNRAATFVNRGVMRMRDGRYDEALSDYASAKRLKPDLAEAYLNEGAALIYQKRFEEAIAPIETSLELDVEEAFAAHYNRAIARENSGDVAGAYADFKRALELRPEWELAETQLSRFEVRATGG